MICPQCGNTKQFSKLERPDTPHNAEIRCLKCDAFVRWLPKPKNKDKRPKNKILPEDLGIDYCQLCLRQKDRLGKNETLTSHHIIEINKGGEDIKENIWVLCTCCHALVNHVRTYLNDHWKDFWDKH
jgi:hypothetical protein